MRHRPLLIPMLATPLLLAAGCMRTMASGDRQPGFTAVSVRFALPSDQTLAADAGARTRALLAQNGSFDGAMSAALAADKNGSTSNAFHVALWGGPFHGCDVTNNAASLTPGSYTFALFDQNNSSLVQGWAEVNGTGIGTLDLLMRWKNSIQEERQKVAYDFELQGASPARDAAVLTEYTEAVQSFARLEAQIDRAIAAETRAQAAQRRAMQDFLSDAEILVMQSDRPTFHSATKAAFSDTDLTMVRSGNPVSKFVLVADYGTAQWKLQQVNRLYSDLIHARAVQWQIVDRLQRRKGRFLMTDHLYHDDAGFIANETSLQNTLAAVERMDERLAELRDRRMALAFIDELITSEGKYATFEQARGEMLRERAQFEAQKQRFDRMFAEAGETSPTRVALEGARQRIAASLETIDRQLGQLDEARIAIAAMADSTEIIHRQGDRRLLTATYVGQDMPFHVRDVVEREALMTMRLQPAESVFTPRSTSLTAMRPGSQRCPWKTEDTAPNGSAETTRVTTTTQVTYGDPVDAVHTAPQDPDCLDADDFRATTFRQHTQPDPVTVTEQSQMGPMQVQTEDTPIPVIVDEWAWTQPTPNQTTAMNPQPAVVQQAEQSHPDHQPGQSHAELARSRVDESPAKPQPRKQAVQDDDCPFLIQLLVPPCWIGKLMKQGQQAKANEPKAKLARSQAAPQPEQKTGRQQMQDDDCPLLIKLLVPPCWLGKSTGHTKPAPAGRGS